VAHPARRRAGKSRPPRDESGAGRATSQGQAEVAADGALPYRFDRDKRRAGRGREGRDRLRTHLSADDPELIWRCDRQRCFGEAAFRPLTGAHGLRPIVH
jgi:hypothetical protein